jgi:hypothetical protein
LRELDKEYKLTDEHYTIDDFIEDLKKRIQQIKRGWIFRYWNNSKTERAIRQQALDQIFGI